ncbi:MAG: hypothetical protein A2Z71_01830 [Chloroflexi bacterium RBG_13_50_21]|nr:MAG: hypothetical protein A2Z71_01830 [Chloroflexi bacterium RBG_13_50_21]
MDAAIYFNNAPEGIDQFGFDTKIKDGIVQDLFITSFGPIGIPFYSLSEVLSIYGEPGEVWVDAYGWPCDYANGPRLLNVSLFYPDQGFFVLYASWGDAEGIMIQACVDSDPLLYLWSPLLNLSYSEAFMRAGLQSGDNPSLPVSEAFGMDTAMFYQTYKGNGTMVCVETQRELWNWCDITPTPTP